MSAYFFLWSFLTQSVNIKHGDCCDIGFDNAGVIIVALALLAQIDSSLTPLFSMASTSGQLLLPRIAFYASGAVTLGASGILFRDLTDFSQWIIKPNRNDIMDTYRNRHVLMKTSVAGGVVNTAIFFAKPAVVPSKFVWLGINAASLGMLFSGYWNPELMMRARNHNALYVTTCQAAKILKPTEQAICTQLENQEPVCFPESQIMRPHVARVGVKEDGTPAVIAYCALTGTGIVYETPDYPDGTAKEFEPFTQLENNLIVMERNKGHVGHQINGIDETKLLQALGEESYDKVGRRPDQQELQDLGMEPAKEVASWRMPVSTFVTTFPHGKVFINDYKEFPDIKKPVLTIYDKIMDLIFAVAIGYHNISPNPIFPTVETKDTRLEPKTRVWGFNVGDDYVAVTEEFVKNGKNGTRNMIVGGVPLVASYDDASESLGIWIRPSTKPITTPVDIHGRVGGDDTNKLERLSTVKNGLFWFAFQNFFPSADVNPTK